MVEYSKEQISKLIKGVYDGTITVENLPAQLYYAIADFLKSGAYKGFGASMKTAAKGDMALLQDLRDNIYMFSAAKTFQQVREMTDALMKGDKIRPFDEFKEQANQIFDTYNKTYLKTEYDTAVGQSQMASKWQDIQKEKDILPYLIYSTIGDACDICAPLNGYTAKVDDPVWDKIMPLNHFHCECLVEQLPEDEATPTEDQSAEKAIKNMSDVFKMNPGKDGYIFSPHHPYFTVPKEYVGLAQKNFNLKIPEKD